MLVRTHIAQKLKAQALKCATTVQIQASPLTSKARYLNSLHLFFSRKRVLEEWDLYKVISMEPNRVMTEC